MHIFFAKSNLFVSIISPFLHQGGEASHKSTLSSPSGTSIGPRCLLTILGRESSDLVCDLIGFVYWGWCQSWPFHKTICHLGDVPFLDTPVWLWLCKVGIAFNDLMTPTTWVPFAVLIMRDVQCSNTHPQQHPQHPQHPRQSSCFRWDTKFRKAREYPELNEPDPYQPLGCTSWVGLWGSNADISKNNDTMFFGEFTRHTKIEWNSWQVLSWEFLVANFWFPERSWGFSQTGRQNSWRLGTVRGGLRVRHSICITHHALPWPSFPRAPFRAA